MRRIDPNTQATLRLLKGPPLSILAALFVVSRPAGVQEICVSTGYSHAPIEAGLTFLESQGFVQRHGYHGGWMLTSLALQLSFFGGALAENQQVDGGSGLKSLTDESVFKPPLLSLAEVQEEDITAPLVQALIALGGVSAAIAKKAVDRALERGLAPEEVARRIEACARYVESPSGQALKWRGSWAAGIIGAGFEPPLPGVEADQDDERFRARFDGYLAQLGDDDETPTA